MLQGTENVTATFKIIGEKILKTAAAGKELKTRMKIEMPILDHKRTAESML